MLEKEKNEGKKESGGCRYFETHRTSWIRKKAHGHMVILSIAHSLKSGVLRKISDTYFIYWLMKKYNRHDNGSDRVFVELIQENFDKLIVLGQSIEETG